MVYSNNTPQVQIYLNKNTNRVGLSLVRSPPTKNTKRSMYPFSKSQSSSHTKDLPGALLSTVINTIKTRSVYSRSNFNSDHTNDMVNIFQAVQDERVANNLSKLVYSNN